MTTLFDVSLDESVQVLKQVLPLMSKQRAPTIPQNYAVWYDYVTRRNEDLTEELEHLIDRGNGFDAASCRTICPTTASPAAMPLTCSGATHW